MTTTRCHVCKGPTEHTYGGMCLPCSVKTRGMTPHELAAYRDWMNGDGLDDELNRKYDQLRVRCIPEIRRLMTQP
ncbi:MAG: hypothetical protein ACLP3C_15635 [Mycobacterium sp.]|uniref:hypothetical protein n=1 Tax=Mycobacterium sp. TaxID=1785 RepID=UPI003F94EB1F